MTVLLCIGFYIVNDTNKSGGTNKNLQLSLKSLKQKGFFPLVNLNVLKFCVC